MSLQNLPPPKRTQYPFADYSSTLKYKTLGEISVLQRQWNTFEFVENYDDGIYQLITSGNFSRSFYQFQNNTYTLKDYNAGQQLHILAYPELPCGTFDSIRNRYIPPPPLGTPLPIETNVSKCVKPVVPLTADEFAKQQEDNAVYVQVSTFNGTHEYKYAFLTMDEKLAYYRGEKFFRGLL